MDVAADDKEVRKSPLAPFAISAAVFAVALIGGLATDTSSSWYEGLDRPAFQPPGSVFGPVWTILYIALGVSAWLAWRDLKGERRQVVMALYAANFVLNALWTYLFFQLHSPVVAGIEILVLLGTIVAMYVSVKPEQKLAAWLLVPYGLWVAFAGVLTWTIALTN